MSIFSELQAALDALRGTFGGEVDRVDVPAAVRRLDDAAVVAVIASATALLRGAESVRIAASGAVAERSTRESGHDGLAQKRGHRSPVSLIQDLTGTTRADAAKQVRLGGALLDAVDGTPAAGAEGEVETDAASPASSEAAPRPRPWHAVLGDALLTGALTSAQHDVILRGLGEPPTPDAGATTDPAATTCADAATAVDDVRVAWATAAAQLIDEAAVRTVEELATAARCIRDLLDPVGAQRRFEERFHGRAFRSWKDRDGIRRGTFTFDDDGGEWVEAILGTALRPRRGGPRFVDPDEKARAEQLATDPRTNDQLAYDLMIDLLRAGALADTKTVFGTRQAGIRIIATATAHADARDQLPAVGMIEDTGAPVPGWLIAQHTCTTGTQTVTLDGTGNPLDLGRESRLFTARQRLTLAVRDGGCRWIGCDRPASYCEAHHIDPHAQGGRTDIDRGILLCRFHHMNLHHGGWRITRTGKDDFLLHPPDGTPPIPLPTRLPRRYAFGDLIPPPRRFHPAA